MLLFYRAGIHSGFDTERKMESHDRKAWFPAKSYGYGWGLPRRWQGWLVLILYAVLLIGGVWIIDRSLHPGFYYGFFTTLTAVLILVIWAKGEKPSWRWGKKD